MADQEGTPNHLKIWPVAFIAAWILRFIFVSIFFRVVPYDIIDSIFQFWPVIHWGLLFGFAGGIGLILMKQPAFREGGAPASSFSPGAATTSPAGGANLVMTGDGAMTAGDGVYPVEMALQRRVCKGDLHVLPDKLVFVNYIDMSIFKANAGRAGGSQGGLIGALIGGLIAHAGSGKRAEQEVANRAAGASLPVEERARMNEYCFSFEPRQIELIKSSVWKGSWIKVAGKKYPFNQGMMSDEVKAALGEWCAANGVAAEL